MITNPQTAADIMTSDVISVRPTTTIAQARALMNTHSIRHLPVVDEGDRFVGVVTQKAMLAEILRITDQFGIQGVASQTEQRPVSEILGKDVETIQPQLSLVEAGKFFLECKHGSLPVLEDGRLVGILTSADFVKLSVALLERA
ncbi:hypothetical protein CAI21_16055 [Alkalilimnicola ehrlichii]|uniref:CBS domain-containing protein n=1 Tax=Alkalilimnicola ehrlichii TaxID=351052 RepID=A0A3E0WLQ1_9GAMM|nr:CBS domain-containing protein [Alkalilimnicola ehrlichii]RFA26795.1 hypothetical protein CAI21_16055 [Alkalilimnicola ehrlichii]RFA33890.1 hypothetical protein CAL65_16175 [Alkalilimnicola ehrlichii]